MSKNRARRALKKVAETCSVYGEGREKSGVRGSYGRGEWIERRGEWIEKRGEWIERRVEWIEKGDNILSN